jgi:Domain of unknown function (DUF3846)
MIKVLYVPAHGTPETRKVKPTLETFQQLVGGNIESIGGEDWYAYLNEEGKLLGLPFNPLADRLADMLGWRGLFGDLLVGPVVFLGPPDRDGNCTPVAQQVLDHAMELAAREAGDS